MKGKTMLKEDLKKLLAEGKLPEEAATTALRKAEPATLIEYAYPAVVELARTLLREINRTREDEAFGDDGDRDLVPAKKRRRNRDDVTSVLGKLHDAYFTVGVVRVTWLAATVEQHEIYLAMLRAMLRGLQVTEARHVWAVQLCTEHGVSTLQEVMDKGVSVTMPDEEDVPWDASKQAVA